MDLTRRHLSTTTFALAALGVVSPLALKPAHADDRQTLIQEGRESLAKLQSTVPRSRFFAKNAHAVLVFPSILKAGFVFGGETGNGVLFTNGKPDGFYNISGGSWGLQIGAQDFAYALFFMTPGSLHYLHDAAGFSAGTGPSITVINAGAAVAADTTTLTQDVYAFPYSGKGLMADLTLQGTKISRIHVS